MGGGGCRERDFTVFGCVWLVGIGSSGSGDLKMVYNGGGMVVDVIGEGKGVVRSA